MSKIRLYFQLTPEEQSVNSKFKYGFWQMPRRGKSSLCKHCVNVFAMIYLLACTYGTVVVFSIYFYEPLTPTEQSVDNKTMSKIRLYFQFAPEEQSVNSNQKHIYLSLPRRGKPFCKQTYLPQTGGKDNLI
ncbi:MAG: hypothetical protein ACK4NY_20660 [Spirosomataceae bacterium]